MGDVRAAPDRAACNSLSYAIVSPVKDEAKDFLRTVNSVVAQTCRPAKWVIVDDGSTDGTLEIARGVARRHDWVTVVETEVSGPRERGTPIIRAFNRGLQELSPAPDVVVKLDGDLFLPAHYFEWVLGTFESDPRAGVVGGIVYVNDGGRWVYDRVSHRTVHGAIKAYRWSCLEDIGGLAESMGWDGIDEFGARGRGWNVHVLTELGVLHYKMRGSAQNWRQARLEEGRGAYYMGYRMNALLLRVGYRMCVEYPPLVGGMMIAAGYARARFQRLAQADPIARKQLRDEQRMSVRLRRRGHSRLRGGGPAYWLTGEQYE